MKIKKLYILLLIAALIFGMTACSDKSEPEDDIPEDTVPDDTVPEDIAPPAAGEIYLYGEQHGIAVILEKEVEIWSEHYNDENMRHLFIEAPYYTAELLNVWMQSDNDDILDALYVDWAGSALQTPVVKDFYMKIKTDCPETVFHGTDVGHQYGTTGVRYLKHLEESGLEDSLQYTLARECIEQGENYYKNVDDVYRENKMTENFIREFDSLEGANVMGIYGGAHVALDAMNYTGEVPCMANQLREHYGDIIQSQNLYGAMAEIDPLRVDTIEVAGKSYEASYFGKQDLTGFKSFSYREYWRLENAYDDFKDNPLTGEVLPYDNYFFPIETGQVFVIDYTMTDGSVMRVYYRSDGNEWEGLPTTEAFDVALFEIRSQLHKAA